VGRPTGGDHETADVLMHVSSTWTITCGSSIPGQRRLERDQHGPLPLRSIAQGRTSLATGRIAQAAGYANNRVFVRAIRKAYRMDPREYRERALVCAGDVPRPVFETESPKESRSC
jgi:AraC-like DNA-binding protein